MLVLALCLFNVLFVLQTQLVREFLALITSANEVIFSSLLVCLSVSNFAQKLSNEFA